MTGLHLDDAALAVASDGQGLVVQPSILHSDPADVARFGTSADDVARRQPLSVSTRHWRELARLGSSTPSSIISLIQAECTARLGATPGPIQIAVPASFGAQTCGVVCSILRTQGAEVRGFHDAAAVTVAAAEVGSNALVLEVGLHHVAASAVTTVAHEVRRRTTSLRADRGECALREAWLELVSEAMVRRARFDPLHDAADEQRLYDNVMDWARTAAQQGSVEIPWQTPTGPLTLTLTRDAFAAAAAPLYHDLLAVLHELRPAGVMTDILVPERVVHWPGLAEAFSELRSCRLWSVAAGVAAAVVSRLPAEHDGENLVTLRRGVLRCAPESGVERWMIGPANGTALPAPTHAVLGERAFALTPDVPLGIGRSPGASGIALPDGARGVSRLHCTLRRVEEGVELIDHSRHGTWLNDERVPQRARVTAGDRIRMGDPAIVISLIAAGEGHGTST